MTSSNYRQLIFAHDMHSWQQSLPASLTPTLILSDDYPDADATLSRYRDYLGHEYRCVVIDCSTNLHVDAIAALAGTVVAGGYLILVGERPDSAMWRRLKSAWPPQLREQNPPANQLPQLPTAEQTALINTLQNTDSVHILSAPRGRGKSHVLGTVIASVMTKVSTAGSKQRIVVTAPRKANAQVLLSQAPNVQFVAWDKLLKEKKGDALLVIDEAAGLPLWAIQTLCRHYTPWLMATTVDGYEGCGRGFAIHFPQWAKAHLPRVKLHRLTQPIRWPMHDPLEHWLQQTLLLTEAAKKATQHHGVVTTRASQLPEADLHQAFELLLTAHYQSSPNDLALLLDDSNQFLTLLYHQQRVIGVCWHALEGPVDDTLRDPILQGKRRPPGNLLPQAIGFYLQQPWALATRWCRIARIAVDPAHRRRHHASTLINTVRHWAQRNSCEALGTSFGYTQELAQFWQYNDFSAIRTSNKRDRVSARYQHIRACWLTTATPPHWHELLAYAQAELAWITEGKAPSVATNVITQQIQLAVNHGHMPRAAARFALNQC